MSFDAVLDGVAPPTAGVDERFTFAYVGTYLLRVGYFVSKKQQELWQPSDEVLWSEAIPVEVRPESTAESALLDAYWAGGDEWYLCDELDSFSRPGFMRERLQSALQAYPEEPYVRYIKYGLVRLAISEELYQEALALISDLAAETEFRRPELVRWKAIAFARTGRKDEARFVVDELLRARPELVDWIPLMSVLVSIDREGAENPMFDWLTDRVAGKDPYRRKYRPEESDR
jgi:hypothetical protein